MKGLAILRLSLSFIIFYLSLSPAAAQDALWATGSALPDGTTVQLTRRPDGKFTYTGPLNAGELKIMTTATPTDATQYLTPQQADSYLVKYGLTYVLTNDAGREGWYVSFQEDTYRFIVDTGKRTVTGELLLPWNELLIAGSAIADGADEVDVVLNVGYFRDEAWEEMCDEIYELKQTIGDNHHLKVILETGLLKTAENIRRASILAMHSGADFIKTSTGKVYSGATLEAAYVMCQCIKEFYEKTGIRVGFKASGGIRTTDDAVKYYTLVREILGEEWLNNGLFRIGASSLANALFASMTGSDQKPF